MSGVVLTGFCTKRGAVKKNWKRRYFILTADRLLSYYKDKAAASGKPKGVISLKGAVQFLDYKETASNIQWPNGTKDSRFQIVTPDRTFFIMAESGNEAAQWLVKLKETTGMTPASTTVAPTPPRAEVSQAEQQQLLGTLKQLSIGDDNKHCFDCGSMGVTWAAWNLGVFLCMRCAGIHRSLGTHISKVKSLTLDVWTREQVDAMVAAGNVRSRPQFEAGLPPNYVRPREDNAAMTAFIREKYINKKFAKANPAAASGDPFASNDGGAAGGFADFTAFPDSGAQKETASPDKPQENFANFAAFETTSPVSPNEEDDDRELSDEDEDDDDDDEGEEEVVVENIQPEADPMANHDWS